VLGSIDLKSIFGVLYLRGFFLWAVFCEIHGLSFRVVDCLEANRKKGKKPSFFVFPFEGIPKKKREKMGGMELFEIPKLFFTFF
jgi:hypothetical protein